MDSYLPSKAVPLGIFSHKRVATAVAATPQQNTAPRVTQEPRFFANLPIGSKLVNTSGMPLPPAHVGLVVPPIVAPSKAATSRSIASAVVPLVQASQQAHADSKALREAHTEVSRLQNVVGELNRRLLLAGDRIAVLGHNRSAEFASITEETKSLRLRLDTSERGRSELTVDNEALQREVSEVKSKMQLAGEKMFEVQTAVVGESRVLQDDVGRLRSEKEAAEQSLVEATQRLEVAVQDVVGASARESSTSAKLAELTANHETAIEALMEANSYRMELERKLRGNNIMLPERPVELVQLSEAIGLNVTPSAPPPQPAPPAATPALPPSLPGAQHQHVVEMVGECHHSQLKLEGGMFRLDIEQHPVKGSCFFDDLEIVANVGSEVLLPGGLDVANTSGSGQKSAMIMKAVIGDFSSVFFSKPLFARRPPQPRLDILLPSTGVAVVVS